jgi:hypothetical protein
MHCTVAHPFKPLKMLSLEDVGEGKICEASTQPKRVEMGTSNASGILPRAIKARIDPMKSRSCGSCMAELPLLGRALLNLRSRGASCLKMKEKVNVGKNTIWISLPVAK